MELQEFKRLFEKYYPPIRNFLYYKLGDLELAEDLAQEVFVRTWQKKDAIIMETVVKLLYTIANNLAKNYYASAKNKYEFRWNDEEKAHIESPDYIFEEKEFKQELENAISALPEGQRTVFLMNRIDGYSYLEIAERLDLSVKAIEKRMSQALAELRKKIKFKV